MIWDNMTPPSLVYIFMEGIINIILTSNYVRFTSALVSCTGCGCNSGVSSPSTSTFTRLSSSGDSCVVSSMGRRLCAGCGSPRLSSIGMTTTLMKRTVYCAFSHRKTYRGFLHFAAQVHSMNSKLQ